MQYRALLVLVSCLWLAHPLAAQPGGAARPDGTLVAQSPCTLHAVTYEELAARTAAEVKSQLELLEARAREAAAAGAELPNLQRVREELLARRPPWQEGFEKAFRNGKYECLKIRYLSDGLQVAGFLFKPAGTPERRLPVVIFNRGGNQAFGQLEEERMIGFLQFLEAGYVVVASQYRGNGGGEGREEFGGADVRDVLNLIPLIRSLGYADPGNVFLYGHSRGGMMTYLALKQHIPVNAAVVGAGPTDLEATAKHRPEMQEVYAELIPDYATRRSEVLRERSVLHWADRIEVPVLILHGTADWRVDPAEALRLASRLQELGKTYSLTMYAGDDHGLSRNREDRDRRILEWFQAYRKPAEKPK